MGNTTEINSLIQSYGSRNNRNQRIYDSGAVWPTVEMCKAYSSLAQQSRTIFVIHFQCIHTNLQIRIAHKAGNSPEIHSFLLHMEGMLLYVYRTICI
jgi:hypothetical protein